MRNILVLGLLAALAASACDKGSTSNPSASGAAASGASPTTSAAPAAGGTLGPASLEVTWTGKWDKGDGTSEYPLMKVVNKDTTRPLTFYQGFFYFYDHDKKQVGREFRDRYQFSIAPGQTTELGAGPEKKQIPKGTEHIEFVVTGANFGSEANKFRVDGVPPEKRPMGG